MAYRWDSALISAGFTGWYNVSISCQRICTGFCIRASPDSLETAGKSFFTLHHCEARSFQCSYIFFVVSGSAMAAFPYPLCPTESYCENETVCLRLGCKIWKVSCMVIVTRQ
ncbi:hypothetical protein AVEN_133266-1 [Araneus ventricosus]|uniref:Uncharacterized protein n=1 Tax=Araneus ventricosus TaxID=182803 RepID=A0A4Y2DMU1_ARAVE|nr:hypothetical protein AVEN_133266-1 [Araneus ventricosus]